MPHRRPSGLAKSCAIAVAAVLLTSVAIAAEQAPPHSWPQFLGVDAVGKEQSVKLPDSWSVTENVAWKTSIPGRGWSSPIAWGDRVFVTTFVQEKGDIEGRKTGFYAPNSNATPDGDCQWIVQCLDLKSGSLLWERVAHRGKPEHSIHVKSSYAAETPATDGERVFALFGNVGLFCFDLSGKPLWSKKWGVFNTQLGWGTGSSPVVHDGRVYVQHDNEENSFLVALDAATGEELWRTSRDEKSSWATPFVWKHDKRTEIVTSARNRARSYDLDGKLLWELGGMSSLCIQTPLAAGGLLYVSSGYEFGQPRPMYAIRPGAAGDITLSQDQTTNDYIAWSLKSAGAYHPSPIVVGERLYQVYSRGLIACFDGTTGETIYGPQRLGGTFTATPVTDGARIFCLDEDGTTTVVQAGAEFKILGRNKLESMSLASPAIVGDRLLVRTLGDLHCIQKR